MTALSPGTRLGPYEILSPLGAGGMGEVYRARDARLGRDVAIKVLVERLAHDREHRARFEREARAVASVWRCFERRAEVGTECQLGLDAWCVNHGPRGARTKPGVSSGPSDETGAFRPTPG